MDCRVSSSILPVSQLVPLWASHHVVAIKTRSSHAKILQIAWGSDGTIMVHLPYYKHADGLLSIATMPAGNGTPLQVSLEDAGKVTSHRVKYSHHIDGRAHFSQDGKILTKIKKQSVPLATLSGHVFTAQAQGLQDFEPVSPSDTKRKSRLSSPLSTRSPTKAGIPSSGAGSPSMTSWRDSLVSSRRKSDPLC